MKLNVHKTETVQCSKTAASMMEDTDDVITFLALFSDSYFKEVLFIFWSFLTVKNSHMALVNKQYLEAIGKVKQ